MWFTQNVIIDELCLKTTTNVMFSKLYTYYIYFGDCDIVKRTIDQLLKLLYLSLTSIC